MLGIWDDGIEPMLENCAMAGGYEDCIYNTAKVIAASCMAGRVTYNPACKAHFLCSKIYAKRGWSRNSLQRGLVSGNMWYVSWLIVRSLVGTAWVCTHVLWVYTVREYSGWAQQVRACGYWDGGWAQWVNTGGGYSI